MPFIIHKNPVPDRLIHMGRVVEVTPVVATMSPDPQPKKQGRPKMADKKKLDDKSGVETIHKEPADKQGPVGTGTQENPPQPAAGEDVKVGGEDKANE